jgi:hypothetical protein
MGAVAATACGGATSGTSPSSSTVQAYQAVGQDMANAITAYHVETSTMADPAACQAAWETYDAAMAGMVDRMQQMSALMDQHMGDYGHTGPADVTCVTNAMAAEFERHATVACAANDVSADRAEAAEHVTTMTAWMEHQRVRYEDVASTMGMMSPNSETTWTCQQNADGSFTMGDDTWTPGTSMPTGPNPEDPTPTPWPPCGYNDGYGGGTSGGSTDPVSLGQRIFETGTGTDGQPIVRTDGYGMMMGGCASCHGWDGHGRRTMMFTTPNITYSNLTDPAGMLEPDGSRGPTFTDELIRRAVVEGVDADGETLSTAMPRWQLSDQDWDDLLLFLKTLP